MQRKGGSFGGLSDLNTNCFLEEMIIQRLQSVEVKLVSSETRAVCKGGLEEGVFLARLSEESRLLVEIFR